jgi:NAD(P)-dependent dehydrogenase (short-subunit alcohol dehydrogenase family)
MQRFAHKTVLVTGAGNGIGQAVALGFALEGARVVVNDLNPDRVATTVALIEQAGGTALGQPADASNRLQVDAMFAQAEQAFGYVDVLVNNAGLTSDQRHFLDATEDWWDKFMRINLKSTFLCSHRAAGIMARRRKGVILTTSSGGASKAHRAYTAYDATKGGIEAFTRAAALDLAPYGVRVNGVVPGFINTYGLEGANLAEREKTVPLGRYGVAQDCVGAALFLASDEAAYITGQFVVVDGGVLVQQRSANVDTYPLSNFPTIPHDLD